MSIAETFDLSIKLNETEGKMDDKYYFTADNKYYNYIDNESWLCLVNEMQTKYPLAYKEYSNGAGDELGIKKARKFPPKMASYGSSSRMIYLLSRDIPDFCFEKKLPTTVGGIANMDGFLQKDNVQFFIEAKCREPYSSKAYVIDRKYEDLYRYIDKATTIDFNCNITIIDDKKMKVEFIGNKRKITSFDIKQMISHLLGIATARLNNPTDEKIKFIYLIYNPTNITIVNSKHEKKIIEAYNNQISECNSIPFDNLFSVILDYLDSIKSIDIASKENIEVIKKAFSFELCDQFNYCNILNNF